MTASAGIDYIQGPAYQPGTPPSEINLMGGAAAGDYDGDGWVDLFVTRGDSTDILYRNLGNGQFQDVTSSAFGSSPLNLATNGAAWGDIDNDGDADLYVTAVGELAHLLYVNQGDGTFLEEAASRGAGVGDGVNPLYGTGIALGDYDRDGTLDLFMGEWGPSTPGVPLHARLLRNLGGVQSGYFEDVTDSAGVSMEVTSGPDEGARTSFSPRFSDLDGDMQPDLAITGDFYTSHLFWNEGPQAATRFSNGTSAAGIATGINDMGSAIGDIDGDGRLDWFITDIDGHAGGHPNGNRLFKNLGGRQFTDITDAAGVRHGDWGWGTAMFDFDNDGDLDITMTNGYIADRFLIDPMRLWENDGSGVFTEIGAAEGVDDTGQGKGLLTFDYDKDGDLDLFVVNNASQPVLLRNDNGNENDYLRVELEGTVSNRDGIGAKITVIPDKNNPTSSMIREVDAGTHYLAQSEFIAHFGLGTSSGTIDEVRVHWPSGAHQVFRDITSNSLLSIIETPGDFDQDFDVDQDDFDVWMQAYGSTTDLIADGNGNGTVDGADLLVWQRHFGTDNGFAIGTLNEIPEPPTGLLTGCMFLGLALSFQRNGQQRLMELG